MFKITTAILGLLFVTLNANANGESFPESPQRVEVGIEGLYLRASGDFLQYTSVSALEPDPVLTQFHIKKIAPNYDWGYGAFIAYKFSGSSNDIKLHGQSFSSEDKTAYSAKPNEILEVPFIINSSLTFNQADSQVNFKYRVLDLNVGHWTPFSPSLLSRFYAGLRYAHIKRTFNFGFVDPVANNQALSMLDLTSTIQFRGLGPQIGLNTMYYFIPCFGLESDFSVSGIAETSKAKILARAVPIGSTAVFTTVVIPDNQNKIVPALDARLGLQYLYPTSNDSTVKLSAGYQYVYYVGALNEVVITTGANTGGISSLVFRKIDTSFQGLYLTLTGRM